MINNQELEEALKNHQIKKIMLEEENLGETWWVLVDYKGERFFEIWPKNSKETLDQCLNSLRDKIEDDIEEKRQKTLNLLKK